MSEVLATPVSALGLTLARSRFAAPIAQVRRELRAVGVALQPIFYLSTEYGCIVRSATISLLWTDGFAFGARLARTHGIRTRTTGQILATLRHEVGHGFCYAHRLYARKRFRDGFGVRGSFFGTYPEVWKPGARDRARYARGEVIYLYATRHPDEDFAICFQVWLEHAARGSTGWRRTYADRPRIVDKLELVAELVAEVGGQAPALRPTALDEPIAAVDATVAAWIAKVRAGTNYNLLPGSPINQ